MLPVEVVVRGYLAGSGWPDYRATGTVCGHALPAGLVESEPPARADRHPGDEGDHRSRRNIAEDVAAALCRRGALRRRARGGARRCTGSRRRTPSARGILVADTKFELGVDADGVVMLGDEALTPDSSRFWPADGYAPGRAAAVVRQAVRPRLVRATGWDKTDPGPELPADVVAGTRARYVEAFERLTGIAFDAYLADPEVVCVKATVLIRPKGGILDPQGEAVRASLEKLGFPVAAARVGRVVDLELATDDAADARAQVERMCADLLANPLIESVEIEIEAPERSAVNERPLIAVVTFPGSNDDGDAALALERSVPRRCACGTPTPSCPTPSRGRAPGRLLLRGLPALRCDRAHCPGDERGGFVRG